MAGAGEPPSGASDGVLGVKPYGLFRTAGCFLPPEPDSSPRRRQEREHVNARITRARHRAARRPLTPLSDIAQSVTNSTTGRRAAVVATAGGLLMSTFGTASAAQAAPMHDDAANKLDTVGIGAIADQAREALEAAPVVTVAADAKLSVETVRAKVADKAITPAPEPEPEPEPVVTTSESTTSSDSTT